MMPLLHKKNWMKNYLTNGSRELKLRRPREFLSIRLMAIWIICRMLMKVYLLFYYHRVWAYVVMPNRDKWSFFTDKIIFLPDNTNGFAGSILGSSC